MLSGGGGSGVRYSVVMQIPFLNWLERQALEILIRSPRTGMVAVKQMDGPLLFVANSPFDEMPMDGSNPIADHLERIYKSSGDGTSEGPD